MKNMVNEIRDMVDEIKNIDYEQIRMNVFVNTMILLDETKEFTAKALNVIGWTIRYTIGAFVIIAYIIGYMVKGIMKVVRFINKLKRNRALNTAFETTRRVNLAAVAAQTAEF